MILPYIFLCQEELEKHINTEDYAEIKDTCKEGALKEILIFFHFYHLYPILIMSFN